MILNSTLQKHLECLEQCEIDHAACELEREDDTACEAERGRCEITCDLDYGP